MDFFKGRDTCLRILLDNEFDIRVELAEIIHRRSREWYPTCGSVIPRISFETQRARADRKFRGSCFSNQWSLSFTLEWITMEERKLMRIKRQSLRSSYVTIVNFVPTVSLIRGTIQDVTRTDSVRENEITDAYLVYSMPSYRCKARQAVARGTFIRQ